jgi:hypothetical protein
MWFLQIHRERIDVLDLAVLTENERLIVATMLLNNMFGGF